MTTKSSSTDSLEAQDALWLAHSASPDLGPMESIAWRMLSALGRVSQWLDSETSPEED